MIECFHLSLFFHSVFIKGCMPSLYLVLLVIFIESNFDTIMLTLRISIIIGFHFISFSLWIFIENSLHFSTLNLRVFVITLIKLLSLLKRSEALA